MNIKNFEAGILRAYYVAWAVFSIGFSNFLIHEKWWGGGYAKDWRAQDALENSLGVGLILAFVVGPGVLMYATRWIYRGFVPKPPS